MGMQTYEELKDILCRELDTIAERGEITTSMLDTTHKLTDTIKNLEKLMMFEDGGYSEDGWEVKRMPYDQRGNSYGRRGSHYVRGHYSMSDGRNYLMSQMSRMSEDNTISPQSRNALRRAMETLERE